MSNIVRIKRRASGGAAGAPSSLENAELAFNEQDDILYYGKGTGGAGGTASSIIPIGGPGAFLNKNNLQVANRIFAGPTSGGDAVPTFRQLVALDIPSLTAAKISDFDTQVRTNRLDQLAAAGADYSLGGFKLTNVAAPVSANDAANKAYVDNAVQGLDAKASVKAATTANIALTGAQTIDDVSIGAGDRVLVKDQSSAQQNGIYIASLGSWSRSSDMDDWAEIPNSYVFIEQGTVNADKGFVCTANTGGTLDTTAVPWVQFNGSGGSYTAGTGIDVSGNVISINTGYLGQASITTLGTIATGVWQGTLIGVLYGGTGLSAAPNGLVKGNGSTTYSAATAGTDYVAPGTATVGTIITKTGDTTSAPLRLPAGVAPTSPTNGDVWATSTALLVRLNGTTKTVMFDGDVIDGGVF
jgi:hypothetical protein